jgi:threonine/homoserine/homoserine lactone efflux protein
LVESPDVEALALYVKAIGFGLAVAAPVGPMAMLCMRRTLIEGWPNGLATGIGIAVGDGLYALVAALGLASVSIFVQMHESLLHIAAGVFLLYLGLKSLFAQVEPNDAVLGSRHSEVRLSSRSQIRRQL